MPDEYDALIDEVAGRTPKSGKSLDYRKLYEEVGGKYGIDPDLLYNQAKQESVNFAPKFVYGPGKSPVGAAGIAQFMPDTARQYGLHVGKGRDDRYNPRLAADAQARMMRDLLDKHGDARLALAAYNSGHNKTAAQAQAAADRIPETRGYVKKIAPKGDPYDQLLDEIDGPVGTGDEYDQLLAEFDASPKATLAAVRGGVRADNPRGVEPGTPAARRAFRQRVENPPPISGFGDVRKAEALDALKGTGSGELLRADEPELRRVIAAQREVDAEIAAESTPTAFLSSSFKRAFSGGMQRQPNRGERLVAKLADQHEADSRRNELLSSLTDEDRRNIADAVARMRGQGSTSRGIETGSQRVGSGLLYKIAGLSDVIGGRENNALGAYLRRQAGRGELAIEQIEEEMPPDAAQQWADFVTSGLGALPEIAGATALAGPVGGFALLGGAEAAGRERPAAEVATETLKGAALGKVFELAPLAESAVPAATKSLARKVADTARSGVAIGVGTIGVEKAFGSTDEQALQSAVANIAFHAAGRIPEVVGRFAQAAERRLKSTDVPSTTEEVATNEARVEEAAVAAAEAKLVQPLSSKATEVEQPSATLKSETPPLRPAEPLPGETYASEELQAAAAPTAAPTPLHPRPSLAERLAARAAEGPEEVLGEVAAESAPATSEVREGETPKVQSIFAGKDATPEQGLRDTLEGHLAKNQREQEAKLQEEVYKKTGSHYEFMGTFEPELPKEFKSWPEGYEPTGYRYRFTDGPLKGREMLIEHTKGGRSLDEQIIGEAVRQSADATYREVNRPRAATPSKPIEAAPRAERREFPREEGAHVFADTERREWTTRLFNMHPEDMAEAQRLMAVKHEQMAEPTFSQRQEAPASVRTKLAGPDPVKRNADLADGPIMSQMRVGGEEVRAAVGIDPKLIPVIAKTMYAKETGVIVPKELLQNAIDAVRPTHTTGSPGKVELDVDTTERTFSIRDNGVGMLPDVVTKEFTDLGGTLKQAMESSGGFGIAKGAMFYNAESIKVDTIARDPKSGKLIQTKVEGSGADWLDHSKGLRVVSREVGTNTAGAPPEWLKGPTGTNIEIRLNPEAKLEPYNTRVFLRNFAARQKTPFDVSINFDGENYKPEKGSYYSIDKKLKTLQVPGAELDVYTKEGPSTYETSWVTIELLNHGLPQANYNISLKSPAKIPSDFLVDVRSKGRPSDTEHEYPWLPSREGLREKAAEAINRYIQTEMAEEAIRAKNQLYIDTIRNAPSIGRSDQIVVDTSGTASPTLIREISNQPHVHRLNDALGELFQKSLDAIYKEERSIQQAYSDANYKGIGLGADYYGVNVKGKHLGMEGDQIFINPVNTILAAERLPGPINLKADQIEVDPTGTYQLAPIADRVDYAARQLAATMTHEISHQASRSHEEDFSSALTENTGRVYGKIDAQVNAIKALLGENDYAAYSYFRELGPKLSESYAGGEDIFGKIGVSHAAERNAGAEPAHPRERNEGQETERGRAVPTSDERAASPLAAAAGAGEPVHHSRAQPRTPDGKFDGPPTNAELIRQAGEQYHRDYRAIAEHPARRESLSIVNDDVAGDYFKRLRRFSSRHTPDRTTLVDQAESAYSRGKYADATRLTEQALAGTHDYPSKLTGALDSARRMEQGKVVNDLQYENWKQVMKEVKRRLGTTGGLPVGGNFYDVNKYPEGGMPDHKKIAYILEPVVDMLRADARRLIAAGKLKATDYTTHIRKAVNDMLATSDFADWHPLNKSAAVGVLVDRLRSEGPPPVEARTTEPAPSQKARSLPKTKEKSGRDPGTDLTYTVVPEAKSTGDAINRILRDGIDKAEEWYRTADHSAERSEVGRLLSDELQVRAADTKDPAEAAALRDRAIELSDIENVRSTEMGQAIQAYARYTKFTPAGVMKEVRKIAARGHEVPAAEIVQLSGLAVDHQRAVSAAKKAADRVAVLEGEGGEGAGSGGPAAKGARVGSAPRKPGEAARARKQLDEAQQRARATKLEIARRLAALEQSRTVAGYYRRSMNITRGLMVSQLSTAMRNLQSQLVRFSVERLTDIVEHTMRKGVGLDSDFTYRRIWQDTKRQLQMSSTAKARRLLSDHPSELARMFNTHMEAGEVPTAIDWRGLNSPIKRQVERIFQTAEKATEIVNFANRLQEFHLRSAEYLAELDLHLRLEKGLSLEKFVKRHGMDAIPLELHQRAVQKALEVTFADMPPRDRAGGRLLGSLIEVGNYIPPTVSPAAFPRFMYNNMKFLYQYNPIGGLIDTAITAKRGGNVPRAVARTLVGTSMFLLAHQFRNSDHAGEKWYEMKFGDVEIDARPFGPFSTYLFMAEAIRRWQRGEKAFTVEEILGALGAATGPTGTGIALAEKLYEYAANGQWGKWQRILKQEGGDFGRALLTPVRQVKDLIAAFDASQAVVRETASEPFLGPIKESIPYASSGLPEAHIPTTATPLRQERPAAKQLTGWRTITSKTFLQRELDSLNFSGQEVLPKTGVPELDDLQEKLMGPLADQLSTQLEKDAKYREMTRAQRGVFLSDLLKDLREEVRDFAEAERPDLFEQMKEERKPRRQKELDRELQRQSQGVSRAIKLGVPLPIPPKRSDEDDLAYRARLIQTGRQQATALNAVVASADFNSLSTTAQRKRLHAAVV